jgi:hypothetical protein
MGAKHVSVRRIPYTRSANNDNCHGAFENDESWEMGSVGLVLMWTSGVNLKARDTGAVVAFTAMLA